MLTNKELGLIALVRASLMQKKVPLPEGFSFLQIFPLVKKHQIATMILEALPFYDEADAAMCLQQLLHVGGLSISISESQMAETSAICDAFEEEKIDYALLKGAIIKDFYPKKYIRSMVDVDILVRMDQYDHVAAIMKRLGFEEGVKSDHEYNWQKGHVHMELHKYLIPSYDKRYYAYFGDGWSLMKPIGNGSCGYAMTDEAQFIYIFTHYAKHFRDGGIGIKHLTDLWVCKNACPNMDEAYIVKQLKKLGLDVFYANVMQTVAAWFEDGEMTPLAEIITREIITSGAYGKETTHKKAEAVRQAKGKHSKFRWMMRKIFLPYKNMCMKYPFLRYVPILLPVMWIVRWITALVCKPKDTKKNMNLARNMSQESVDDYCDYLASLGLYFEKE